MNKLNQLKLGFFIFVAIFIIACKKQEATVPSYLNIDSITLESDYATEGTSSSNITEAFVYANNQLIGVYEIPARVPIIYDGNVEVQINPAVRNSGSREIIEEYTFYNPISETINLQPLDEAMLSPITTYSSNTNFWIENFDDPSIKFSPYDSNYGIRVDNSDENVFEGVGSGYMSFNDTTNLVRVETDEEFQFPRSGEKTFLEINYKNDLPFKVYLLSKINGIDYRDEILQVYSKLEWSKMYIDLSFLIQINNGASSYEIGFEVNQENYSSNSKVWLDNIKIVN